MKDSVKINPNLKKRIEKIIGKGEMSIEYPSLKNFVDRAILKQLKDAEKKIDEKK